MTLPPFQRVLDEYRDLVWRRLCAIVGPQAAEDCFQETFLAALRAYPTVRDASTLRGWLLTIAHNKAIDHLRGAQRNARAVAEHSSAEPQAGTEIDADRTIWSLVEKLSDRQRAVVLLRFAGDLPHRDIAARLGCSEEAARRALHDGLYRLRQTLGEGER